MESVSLVPGRVGTDNDSDHYYTLLGTEETNQAISSNPQDYQNIYCN